MVMKYNIAPLLGQYRTNSKHFMQESRFFSVIFRKNIKIEQFDWRTCNERSESQSIPSN